MDPYQMIQQNNAWSAQQAQKQMDFQERMSNTAHQREIADLKAAGLNPVLSAKLGGASTPSGAMGDTDTSGTAELIRMMFQGMSIAGSAATAASNATELMKTMVDPETGEVSWSLAPKTASRLRSAIDAAPIPGSAKSALRTALKTIEYHDKPSYSKVFNFLNNMSSVDPFGLGYLLMPKAERDGSEKAWALRYK